MNRRPRWISAPLEAAGSSAMVLLLLLGSSDLHSPRLIACNATPTPVLAGGPGPEVPGHVESTEGALAPDHAPALLKAKQRLAVRAHSSGLRLEPRVPQGRCDDIASFDLPPAPMDGPSAARAPPCTSTSS